MLVRGIAMALYPGDRFGFAYQGDYQTAEIVKIEASSDGSTLSLELRTDSGITLTESLPAAELEEMNITDLENYLSRKYETFEC